MMMQRTMLMLTVTMGVCAPLSSAQSPAQSDPGVVALRHLRAMLKADWRTSAALTQPSELAKTRAAFEPIFMADTDGITRRRVLGEITVDEMKALTDVEFNARLFEFHVRMASQGTAFGRFTDVEIFAVAAPQADTAYVVWQWKLPANERPLRGPGAMRLIRHDAKWWLEMLTDFEGLRQILSR